MAVRTRDIDRVSSLSKASAPTIGRGEPINSRGVEGDIAFRRTSSGLKLYIKASGKWHGVKVGESFNSLEKSVEKIKSTLRTMNKFKLPSVYDVVGDFTLDSAGDIELNADGGQVAIKDDTASHFLFDCDNTAFTIYDDQDEGDLFKIQVAQHGRTTISTVDDDAIAANLILDIDGTIRLNADGGTVEIYDDTAKHFVFDCDNTRFRMFDDANEADFLDISIGAEGATTITTVDADTAVAHLTLAPDGDLVLDPVSQKTIINATDILYFDGGTETYITEASADNLRFVVGGDRMFVLDEANDRITLEATKLVYELGSNGDEWSVADSAWAGTIVGYRMIGEDAAHTTYTTTTSLAVPDSDMTVRFEAPPSGAVEVEVQVYVDSASGRYIYFGLSDNATYNTIGASYEHLVHMADETDQNLVTWKVVVTGLTAGNTYNYWFGAKGSGGTNKLAWGGTTSTRYTDFIMKVTALPTAVADYAVYD